MEGDCFERELDDRGSLVRRGPDTVHLHVYTFGREFIAWISKSWCSSMLSVKVLHTGLKINSSAWLASRASFLEFLVAHPKMK